MNWLKLTFAFVVLTPIIACQNTSIDAHSDNEVLQTYQSSVSIDFADIVERNELRVAVDYSATTYFL